MNWYASFEFLYADGDEPRIVLEDVDTDPLRLFGQIRTIGHVYRVAADDSVACLQIASELIEADCGPAPQRIRLSAEALGEIRATIHQKSDRNFPRKGR
ncbi:MAG: hypothetical protein HUU20_16650 [Pirellulales bacterium]|nr:hypothetical protein [Pirellulales bacterium]